MQVGTGSENTFDAAGHLRLKKAIYEVASVVGALRRCHYALTPIFG